jgi:hypothetical protein
MQQLIEDKTGSQRELEKKEERGSHTGPSKKARGYKKPSVGSNKKPISKDQTRRRRPTKVVEVRSMAKKAVCPDSTGRSSLKRPVSKLPQSPNVNIKNKGGKVSQTCSKSSQNKERVSERSFIRRQGTVVAPKAEVMIPASETKGSNSESPSRKCNWKPHLAYFSKEDFLKSFETKGIPVAESEIVLMCFDALLDIFYMHGLRHSVEEVDEKYKKKLAKCYLRSCTSALDYLIGKPSGSWIKYFKVRCGNFYSACRNQMLIPTDIPDRPDVLFGGIVFQYQTKILKHSRLWPQFLETSLLSKKGMPRASENLLLQKMREYTETMTTPLNLTDEESENVNALVPYIDRVVNHLFLKNKMKYEDLVKPYFPSTSSNYNRSRREAGQVGEVVEVANMLWTHLEGSIKTKKVPIEVLETESPNYQTQQNEKTAVYCEEEVLGVEDEDINKAYEELWIETLLEALQHERPLVSPLALAEALKIRMITKGPPKTYFVLKPIQKFMWEALKNKPCTQLVGKPLTAEIIDKVIGVVDPETEEVASGDYSAATDDIPTELSEYVVAAFAKVALCNLGQEITEALQFLMLNATTRHVYVDSESGEEKLQMRGQLMGSIISFPILCIINFAVCLRAYEQSTGKRCKSLYNLPILINGDDCLIKGLKGIYDHWLAAQRGIFKPSIGKVYVGNFCVMNSLNFHYNLDHWEQTPRINLGLVYGFKRSSCAGNNKIDNVMDISTKQRKLLRECHPDSWELVNKFFFYYNSRTIKSYRGPWFLPKYVTGLGLVGKPSNTDKYYGAAFKMLKLTDKVVTVNEPSEWQMHASVMRDFKIPVGFSTLVRAPLQEKMVDMNVLSNKGYTTLVLSSLFRKTLDQLKVECKNSRKIYKKSLRSNEKLWNQAKKANLRGVIPLSDAECDDLKVVSKMLVANMSDLDRLYS